MRRRHRSWQLQCFMICCGFMLFSTAWIFLTLVVIVAQEQQREQQLLSDQQRYLTTADDYVGRGIQVIVGHYNGKIPGADPPANLSKEVLNLNSYNPVTGSGASGHAVRLQAVEEARAKTLFQINQFNLVASDKIPLDRTLPDVRKLACREKKYATNLPSTSVVIVFHNEAWSTLLRTVVSVINRSPRSALKEVLLVDDASEREFLGAPLEKFVAQLSVPVRVLRTQTRAGLIRARLFGASKATGDVLTFLDSHCEATEGWLQPLLARIAEDRTAVVCPVIDVINDQTFAYQKGIELFRGGFNWNLQFRWYAVSPAELRRRRGDTTAPIWSPTMAGGLFAIDRRYFYEIGSYDNEMDIWGGENLEMSFRVWQCGGKVEILPCSHVGHVFRKASPHDFPDKGSGTILNSNLARVAEVWMDDWKTLFYKTAPQAEEISKSLDVFERTALRKKLKCKSFAWYLDTVWPEHFLPKDHLHFGRIRWSNSNQCLVSLPGAPGKRKHSLTINQCTLGFDLWQLWILSKQGQIKSDEHQCLQAVEVSKNWIVQLKECSDMEHEYWDYAPYKQQIVHRESGLCLDTPIKASQPDETRVPSLRHCARDASGQKWALMPVKWAAENKS